MAIYAKGQETIQLSDLVGKWKLTKVEVVKMQGEIELSRTEYTPTGYIGAVAFEEVEIFTDAKTAYSGKCIDGLREGGNIQLSSNSAGVVFHGKQTGVRYIFHWQINPTSFVLEQRKSIDQQGRLAENTHYYYEKQ